MAERERRNNKSVANKLSCQLSNINQNRKCLSVSNEEYLHF